MVKVIDNTREVNEISVGTVLKYKSKYYMIIVIIAKEETYTLLDLETGLTNGYKFSALQHLIDEYEEATFFNDKEIALCIDDM